MTSKKFAMAAVFVFAVLLMFLFFVPGCTPEEAKNGELDPAIKVVTTIYPLADIAGRLGGEEVAVSYLLPAGASPHTYEPTVEQARMLEQADLLIYVGAGLDNWAVNMTEAAGSGPAVLKMSERVDMIETVDYYRLEENAAGEKDYGHDCDSSHDHHNGHDHGDCDHGPQDPHFWLDPLIVRDLLGPAIHEKLVEQAPGEEQYFDRRYEEYHEELTGLHEEIEAASAGFSRTGFIAFHSAWQYFAERYGLEEVAVIAQFPGQEPSAGWVAELVELIRQEEIGGIFAEPQFSSELADRIAEESGTEVLMIDPLGGEDVEGRESYLDLMRFNLAVFKEAME